MQREIIEKQRVVIQFLQSLDVSPSKTLIQLKKSFGDQTLSRTAVFEWHRRFNEGRESTSDDERCGRPALVAKKREMVKSMLDRDRRVSTREVAEECDIGVATAYKLITEEFEMTKVCGRWLPRLLDDNQMKDRVNKSLNFLRSYRREGDIFLQRIITTDETWFQGNAPAHRARYTELELDVLGIGRLEPAPYSPGLAPLDFVLFPAVKAQLRGIRFDDLESLRCHVQTIMS
ncbi:protein GVQW3-like [Mya arenaria]|uniref:protein GVQW3-like n=1 Tax=Mya arenaria TaxID=6604 RepID=UPI0022E90E13|nr:protein GVQW3-like [Mya arenaria]